MKLIFENHFCSVHFHAWWAQGTVVTIERVVRVPIGLFRMELVSAEVAIACTARVATSTDNGHWSIHVTGIETCAQDRFINFGIIKFYRILIEAIASSRDVPQVIVASRFILELRIHHIVVVAGLTRDNATCIIASKLSWASRRILTCSFVVKETLCRFRHHNSIVIL